MGRIEAENRRGSARNNVEIEAMSVQLTVDIPEGAFSVFKDDAAHFAAEMRIAAAVKWFETGRLSQAKAAEIAGLSREAFLDALHRYEVSPFQLNAGDLEKELRHD